MQPNHFMIKPERGRLQTAVEKRRGENDALRDELIQFASDTFTLTKNLEESLSVLGIQDIVGKRAILRSLLKERITDSDESLEKAEKALERYMALMEDRQIGTQGMAAQADKLC